MLTDDQASTFSLSNTPVCISSYYQHPALQALLLQLQQSSSSPYQSDEITHSSLLLLPVQALLFLDLLFKNALSFGILVGDATIHSSDVFHHVRRLYIYIYIYIVFFEPSTKLQINARNDTRCIFLDDSFLHRYTILIYIVVIYKAIRYLDINYQ